MTQANFSFVVRSSTITQNTKNMSDKTTDLFLQRNAPVSRRLQISSSGGAWSLSSQKQAQPSTNNTRTPQKQNKEKGSNNSQVKSPIMLSPIRSARLTNEADSMSETVNGSSAGGFMGPFSVTDDRCAYGKSATIAKNYRLHSSGLTMDLLKHSQDHIDAVSAKEADIAAGNGGTSSRSMLRNSASA